MTKQNVKLLLNYESDGHQQRLLELIGKSKKIECVVAFAKMSGWKKISAALKVALDRNLQLRFTTGLSFYQTEPEFLREVFKLSKRYTNLELYIGDTPETFHPKIYAFSTGRKNTIIVGSANFTSGGFSINYEASAEIDDIEGILMAEVVAHVDSLIKAKVIKLATQPIIDVYERKFEINKIHQAIARRRAGKAIDNPSFDPDTLQAALNVLKEDKSDEGFEASVAVRRKRRTQAVKVMRELLVSPPSNREDFLERYDSLIRQFSSGGLQRGKTRIANNYPQFLEALREVQALHHASPEIAYGALAEYFDGIDRAGVNILTEILLALNSKRFANMNKNAVAGMQRANILQFPDRPLKTNVSAQLYAEYCVEAERLRERLGLADFIELDTLFNHLYWN